MKGCSEIDLLVTPFVDGEATPVDRQEVAAHLGACPSCLRHAGAEQMAREVVRAQANGVITTAPVALRARCETSRPPTSRLHSRPSARRTSWPLALAATLVLAVAGAFGYGTFINPAVATAAQLTLDHLKCFTLFDQPGESEPADVRARLRQQYGWEVDIPNRDDAGGLQLVGGRRCVYLDGTLVHLMYRKAGERVSVFILPAGETLPHRNLGIVGYSIVAFERGQRTWVVLAHQSDTDVEQIASRFGSDEKDHRR
jgi:anti-sigma factor (TIGR02949 family)